jgi:hypothetical protein
MTMVSEVVGLEEAVRCSKMEMEQMMERLEAATESVNANLEEMRAGQERLTEEMLAKIETNQGRMDAKIVAN